MTGASDSTTDGLGGVARPFLSDETPRVAALTWSAELLRAEVGFDVGLEALPTCGGGCEPLGLPELGGGSWCEITCACWLSASAAPR